MSARDYLRLLTDSPTIVRTLRQKYGTPDPALELPYCAGAPTRASSGVHPNRVEVRVARVVEETPSTKTLVLAPLQGSLPPYLPGQYVNVFVEVEGVKTSRPMSIASAPGGADELSLTIKRMPGGFVSHHLTEAVRVGDRLTISGPEGDFHHSPVRDGDDLVFIAGGSGITPFIGMIEHLLVTRPTARILLLYGSRTPGEIIFERRLRELAARHARFNMVLIVEIAATEWEGEIGRLDASMLLRHIGDAAADRTYFVCGPPAMQSAVKGHLAALGIRAGRIRFEATGPPEDPAQLPGWPAALDPATSFKLRIEGTDAQILVRAGEPLLNALERAGHTVPALCRAGHCGSCRTKVVRGDVLTPAEPAIRGTDKSAGFVHACVGYPTSDLTIRVSSARARLASGAQLAPDVEAPAPAAVAAGAGYTAAPPLALEEPSKRKGGPPYLRIALALSCLALLIYLIALIPGKLW